MESLLLSHNGNWPVYTFNKALTQSNIILYLHFSPPLSELLGD